MTTDNYISRKRVELIPHSHIEKTIGNTGAPVKLPVVNMDETEEEYVIYMTLAGIRREHVGIVVHNDSLVISAGKKENEQLLDDRCEYDYCGWTGSFRLPADADSLLATASLRTGELQIHIPRSTQPIKGDPVTLHIY